MYNIILLDMNFTNLFFIFLLKLFVINTLRLVNAAFVISIRDLISV